MLDCARAHTHTYIYICQTRIVLVSNLCCSFYHSSYSGVQECSWKMLLLTNNDVSAFEPTRAPFMHVLEWSNLLYSCRYCCITVKQLRTWKHLKQYRRKPMHGRFYFSKLSLASAYVSGHFVKQFEPSINSSVFVSAVLQVSPSLAFKSKWSGFHSFLNFRPPIQVNASRVLTSVQNINCLFG